MQASTREQSTNINMMTGGRKNTNSRDLQYMQTARVRIEIVQAGACSFFFVCFSITSPAASKRTNWLDSTLKREASERAIKKQREIPYLYVGILRTNEYTHVIMAAHKCFATADAAVDVRTTPAPATSRYTPYIRYKRAGAEHNSVRAPNI